MALRRIVLQGEDCLTKVCRPVTDFDNRLHILLNDMADTLLDSGGVGLAAPQVGILRRVCVVQNENDEIIELINPEIVYTQGEQTGLEGCLSVPGKFGVVTRPEVVRVRAQDRDGSFFEVEDGDLTARCFCHEIEHLDGHLFVEQHGSSADGGGAAGVHTPAKRRTRRNADFVYGNAGVCCGAASEAGRGRTRYLRRIYPAG
ncbi:MAG: peptide deformylase [Oscillospiraceae bacterium]